MAHDLAETIIKMSEDIHNSENTSHVVILINKTHKLQYDLIKYKHSVKIININKKITYHVKERSLLKQIWTLLIKDELSLFFKTNMFIDNGIGIALFKTMIQPSVLFDSTTDIYTKSDDVIKRATNIIDFVCLVSDPNFIIE